ncbi:Hypothetical predicted protein [Xyrichtys novacula]|uniref:Uncharacterized protein n=1 Tax=Xyrichtys novacula TaxID=13765 RepID=A0AAV1F5C5_XYRNO|nr:Hypothetical predicted protein [Xyrichtys novacula]
MKLSADLFDTKRLFIAGTRILLLCVDFNGEPAAPGALLWGPNSRLPPSAAVMDGVEEERDMFPRRPSVSLQVKQHSIQRRSADVSSEFEAEAGNGLYEITDTT